MVSENPAPSPEGIMSPKKKKQSILQNWFVYQKKSDQYNMPHYGEIIMIGIKYPIIRPREGEGAA